MAVSRLPYRALLFSVTLIALVNAPVAAQPTLFNTGVNAAGVQLALGAADPHYTVVENSNASAFVVTNQTPGPYVNSPNALWIWQTAGGTPGSVVRTFRQIFDLTGFNPSTASITGRYAADNSALIQLNGVTVGPASSGFSAYTNFTLNTNFLAGVNFLDFVVTDAGAPGGLIVDQLALTASPTGAVNGPEPASLALVAMVGFGGILARRRRR